tara:strand:+ start:3787 stop:4950 length:1164 start_codon:yes stop_codon:yes gene_type:complete
MSTVSDYSLANQGFSAFRTELNNILGAINTHNLGTSAPSSLAAGSIWVDSSSSGTHTLKYYDGSDSITLCDINTSANTVNFIDSTVASDLVNDSSPQLGANLDTNSFNILIDDAHFIADENGNEQIIFQTTASAVNQFDITNAATGNNPIFEATGGDSNVGIDIKPKGTGEVVVGTGAAAATVTSKGAFNLVLDTNEGTNSGNITIVDAANGNIQLTPNGTGYTELVGNTNPGAIRFNCENNSHGVTIKGPAHSASATYTLTLPTSDGNADEVLKTDGSGVLSWGVAAGGTSWQTIKTSGFTAAAGEGYFCNTTSGAFTATLPASPSLGDEVTFVDYAATFDTNNLTVGRNSKPIMGAAEDLTVAVERAGLTLVFVDDTNGWLLKDK